MNFRKVRPSPTPISNFPIPSLEPTLLKNGQQAYIQNSPGLDLVRIELFWLAGSKDTQQPFVSALAGEMLFSGNPRISEEEIIKKLDYHGASYSMDTGINTSSISVRFQKKHSGIIIPWVLDNIGSVTYPDVEVENNIMIRSAGIERQQQTPKYWSNRIALEALYGITNPLSRFGEVADLESINSSLLNLFRQEHLDPGSSMVFFAGDIDNQVLGLIENHITLSSSLPFTRPNKISQHYPANGNKTIKKSLPNASQVSLQMAKHIVPDCPRDKHILTMLNLVLGGYFGSRLMQELREKQGLTYGIGSYFKSAFDDYTWIISGEMNGENIESSIEAIYLIFNDLRTELINIEELNKLKQYYSGIFRSGFDGPFALSNKVQSNILKHQDHNYYTTVLGEIWSITSEEILSMANRHLIDDSFVIGLAGNL